MAIGGQSHLGLPFPSLRRVLQGHLASCIPPQNRSFRELGWGGYILHPYRTAGARAGLQEALSLSHAATPHQHIPGGPPCPLLWPVGKGQRLTGVEGSLSWAPSILRVEATEPLALCHAQ